MSRPKIAWKRLQRAYEKGDAPRALAQQYGVSPSSVYRHIRMEGWIAPSKKQANADRVSCRKKSAPARPIAASKIPTGSVLPQLHQAARRLQTTAAVLLTAAENGDEVSIRDVKDLASLLRELTALATSLDESDSGPDLVRVVLEPPLDEWAL